MRLVLILALVFASPLQAGEPFSRVFSGIWHGVGIQTTGSDWSMELTLGPTLGVVRYPSLRCGGRWQYLDETADSLSGIETIDYGLENCIETGKIYLQPYQNDQMVFMWCGEEEGVSALAVLSRNAAPTAGYEAQKEASQQALDALGYALGNITCQGSKWLGV